MLKEDKKVDDWCGTLRGQGVNVDKALVRMKGNETAYREFLIEFFDDPDFDSLEEAVKAGDVWAAFDYAHGLKGMAANLGLDEICRRLNVLVEILRAGSLDGTVEAYEELAKSCSTISHLL